MTTPPDFTVGDTIAIHPCTDAFMRGHRFGTVTKIGRRWIHVRTTTCDIIKISPTLIRHQGTGWPT